MTHDYKLFKCSLTNLVLYVVIEDDFSCKWEKTDSKVKNNEEVHVTRI